MTLLKRMRESEERATKRHVKHFNVSILGYAARIWLALGLANLYSGGKCILYVDNMTLLGLRCVDQTLVKNLDVQSQGWLDSETQNFALGIKLYQEVYVFSRYYSPLFQHFPSKRATPLPWRSAPATFVGNDVCALS